MSTITKKINGYANQANVLLTSMTGLIIATASKLIPTQDQIVLIIVFAALWAEAYAFRLLEKKVNVGKTPEPTGGTSSPPVAKPT